MKLKVIIFLIGALTLSCCSDNKQDENLLKIEKALSLILNEKKSLDKSEYIVNPYFSNFDFNRYSKQFLNVDESINDKPENKKEIFKTFNWTDDKFEEIKADVNNKYDGKFSNFLDDLSTVNKSNNIYTFSGVNENLIFVEYIRSKDKIEKNNFPKNFNQSNVQEVLSLVVVFENDEPTKVFVDSAIFNE